MLAQGREQDIHISELRESINILMNEIKNGKESLFCDCTESTKFIIALCRNINLLNNDNCTYVLTELTKLVKVYKTGLSLALYRELNKIAEEFNHAGLKAELEQL
jgi:hypothetical protein